MSSSSKYGVVINSPTGINLHKSRNIQVLMVLSICYAFGNVMKSQQAMPCKSAINKFRIDSAFYLT